MRLKAAITLILLLAAGAFAQTHYIIHIYHPGANDPTRSGQPVLFVAPNLAGAAHPGAAMTAEGDGWYTYSVPVASIPAFTQVQFFFATHQAPLNGNPQPGYTQFFNGGQWFNLLTIFKEAGISEIWITPKDLSGTIPPTISELPPGKRVVYILNPWLQSAPSMRFGSSTAWNQMRPSSDPKRCGWYYFPIKDGAAATVLFKNNLGAQTYGRTGLNNGTAIDLSAQFTASVDTLFVLPTPSPDGPPDVRSSFPAGSSQPCFHPLAITVRDFAPGHPDFEGGANAMGDQVRRNMVAVDLGPDRKPRIGTAPHPGFQTLFNWFTDDTTNPVEANRAYPTCYDLPMKKDKNGYFGFDSYNDMPSKSFFPIDNFKPFPTAANNARSKSKYRNRGAAGGYPNDPTNGDHNFHFCMEMHADFTYEKGQVFDFEGDDDMWVFVNNKLALDLGGTHDITVGGIKMDSLAARIGLKEGEKYPFDLFYCERQTDGSNLMVKTSIYFEQPSVVLVRTVVNGVVTYKVREIQAKDRSCGAPTTGGDTVDAPSRFELTGPGITTPVALPLGVSHGGVISINPAKYEISLDTTKPWTLRPGTFVIDFFTEKTGRTGQIKFTIPGSYVTEFTDKRPVSYTGELAAVSIQTVENGAFMARADTVKLAIPPGLLVYADSAKTLPIASGANVAIPAGGKVRVFVTSDTPGSYDLVLMGGPTPAKAIQMDSENFRFEKQLKVTLSSNPPPGNFLAIPYPVSLVANPAAAVIVYTLDGSDPKTSATKITYAGPIPLSATTTIRAVATAPNMIESDELRVTYTYTPPAGVKKAWYKDANGDGRIETVVIEFTKELNAAPAKLAFTIADPKGAYETRAAAGAEIAQSGAVTTVTLANPFPYGVTGLINSGTSGTLFDQPAIPIMAGNFAIDDSVAPVIVKAEVKEPDSTHVYKRILLELSEPADLPLNSQGAVVFKRNGTEYAAGEVRLYVPSVKNTDRTYTLQVDTASGIFPIVGDSVALAPGEVRDAALNAPTRKNFIRLDGTVPPPKPMDFYVTFPNSTRETPSRGGEYAGQSMFIPVNQSGVALSGAPQDGKCVASCGAMEGGAMVGPVFHIVTPGPVEYEFKIFSNTGEFVASGKGRITDADLPSLQKKNDASGIKYIARVVWTGRTHKGLKAGTGAYILQSTLLGTVDSRTGAPPGRDTRRITFGMLRSFRG